VHGGRQNAAHGRLRPGQGESAAAAAGLLTVPDKHAETDTIDERQAGQVNDPAGPRPTPYLAEARPQRTGAEEVWLTAQANDRYTVAIAVRQHARPRGILPWQASAHVHARGRPERALRPAAAMDDKGSSRAGRDQRTGAISHCRSRRTVPDAAALAAASRRGGLARPPPPHQARRRVFLASH